jgi:hypothetical protein
MQASLAADAGRLVLLQARREREPHGLEGLRALWEITSSSLEGAHRSRCLYTDRRTQCRGVSLISRASVVRPCLVTCCYCTKSYRTRSACRSPRRLAPSPTTPGTAACAAPGASLSQRLRYSPRQCLLPPPPYRPRRGNHKRRQPSSRAPAPRSLDGRGVPES